jgi:hypothetical protein
MKQQMENRMKTDTSSGLSKDRATAGQQITQQEARFDLNGSRPDGEDPRLSASGTGKGQVGATVPESLYQHNMQHRVGTRPSIGVWDTQSDYQLKLTSWNVMGGKTSWETIKQPGYQTSWKMGWKQTRK